MILSFVPLHVSDLSAAIYGQTRIHLDQVAELGNFIELEVVLKKGQDKKEGFDIAHKIIDRLNIKTKGLINCSYIDLILINKAHET